MKTNYIEKIWSPLESRNRLESTMNEYIYTKNLLAILAGYIEDNQTESTENATIKSNNYDSRSSRLAMNALETIISLKRQAQEEYKRSITNPEENEEWKQLTMSFAVAEWILSANISVQNTNKSLIDIFPSINIPEAPSIKDNKKLISAIKDCTDWLSSEIQASHDILRISE